MRSLVNWYDGSGEEFVLFSNTVNLLLLGASHKKQYLIPLAILC